MSVPWTAVLPDLSRSVIKMPAAVVRAPIPEKTAEITSCRNRNLCGQLRAGGHESRLEAIQDGTIVTRADIRGVAFQPPGELRHLVQAERSGGTLQGMGLSLHRASVLLIG